MLRGIWGDDERYVQTYWSKFPHMYLAGDGCSRDEDGDYWFMGRIDDVMNVSGHRISTTEVESALVDAPRGRRGGRRRPKRRRDGSGDRVLRHAESPCAGLARPCRRAARARGSTPRKIRHAEIPDVHAGAPQDAQRKDHAPFAAGHRGRPYARRHRRRWPIRASSPSCSRARRTKLPKKSESGMRKGAGRATLRPVSGMLAA